MKWNLAPYAALALGMAVAACSCTNQPARQGVPTQPAAQNTITFRLDTPKYTPADIWLEVSTEDGPGTGYPMNRRVELPWSHTIYFSPNAAGVQAHVTARNAEGVTCTVLINGAVVFTTNSNTCGT